MKNNFFFLLIFFTFLFCTDKKEDDSVLIFRMLDDEKYETANQRIKEKFSTKKVEDELLSSKSTKERHLVEISNDRNRVVYTQDKTIFFKDLANPLTKQISFSQIPFNLSISSDAEHALVSIPIPNGIGCRLFAVSLLESKEAYSSKSIIPCYHHGGITSDGNTIYYFIDDSLYLESTIENKSAKLIRDKKFFSPVANGIKSKFYIYPIGKTFLIFMGDGGVYHLFWLDPKKQEEEKLMDNVATPKIFYGNGKNTYIVTGSVGELFSQELKLSAYGKPIPGNKIQINHERTNPWPTSIPEEFISSFEGEVFRWKEDKKIKTYPLFVNNFWVVARDQIIFIDRNNDLVLTSLEFAETDYKLLEIYHQTKK